MLNTVSEDTHLGDKTINNHEEASQERGCFGKEWGLPSGQIRGRASGVAVPVLVPHLPAGYWRVCVRFVWFCMSVLYFTITMFLVMNPLKVHITYSLSGIWLWGDVL